MGLQFPAYGSLYPGGSCSQVAPTPAASALVGSERECHRAIDREDGILLVDRGRFFETVLDAMRARMRELRSRRVFLEDGSWYWDLRPDFRFGEVVEI